MPPRNPSRSISRLFLPRVNLARRGKCAGPSKPLLSNSPDFALAPMADITQPFSAKRVSLEFAQPVSDVKIESASPYFTATALPGDGKPRSTIPVELRFAESVPLGYHKFGLTMKGTFTSPSHTFSKRIDGVLPVVADIQANPREVVTGFQPGATREEWVTLSSVSGRAFVLVGATVVNERGSGVSVQVSARDRLTITVRPTQSSQSIARDTVCAYLFVGLRIEQATIEVTVVP